MRPEARGQLAHEARSAGARLCADTLRMHGEFHDLAAQIPAHRLGDAVRCPDGVLFELPQVDQGLLEVVVGEVLAAPREALESLACGGGRAREGLFKRLHFVGEQLAEICAASARVAWRSTGDGAHHLPGGLGIDAALLQDLIGQFPDPIPDRLLFIRGRGR